MPDKYMPTIGLEIHAELKTKTKLFCDSPNDSDEKHPNVNVCPICLGHPGTLPVLNKQAVEHVIKVGLALHSEIPSFTKWDRKNYFYPDLPKGYQISQYDLPLCKGGFIEIKNEKGKSKNDKEKLKTELRRIHIRRIHLEEDTGRLYHPAGEKHSLVDFNRAGVPLMELVTEPDMTSGEEARVFARELQLALRYLGVSDADMEKGQMRVEANVSVRDPDGPMGTKVEVKNLNSFRAVERAIQYEVARQSALLESGGQVIQETRGWHDAGKLVRFPSPEHQRGVSEANASPERSEWVRAREETFSQRVKEEAEEYRYLPEPDLPPLDFTKNDSPFVLADIARAIPEMPWQKRQRMSEEYQLPAEQGEILVSDSALAQYYERAVSELKEWLGSADIQGADAPFVSRLAANYLTSDLLGLLQAGGLSISDIRITPENFAELIKMIAKKEISSRVAKDVLAEMLHHGGEPDPSVIVQEKGLAQVGDEAVIEEAVKKAIAENQQAVADFKSGKQNALQFLAGQVMKAMEGAANPAVVQKLLREQLDL